MKKSEYKKELSSLLKKVKNLNEKREMMEKTSEWLFQRSVDICKRMDDSEKLPWKDREKLLREAEEIAGRMSFDLRNLSKGEEEEKTIMDRLDLLTNRKIKEGLEDG